MNKENEYRWDSRHQLAFERLKQMLTTAPVLQYFVDAKPVVIECDASQSGLGAALLQDGKVVEFASRAMTEAEKNYAQIEKELLPIVFAVTRWDTYTYGRSVEIYTDHKPLLAINKKSMAAAPKRLQRMLLQLQRYDINLTYRPGSQLILADTLSRAFPPTGTQNSTKKLQPWRLWIMNKHQIYVWSQALRR